MTWPRTTLILADPAGDYVPELAGLPPAHVHTPWRLDAATRRQLGYPGPLIDLT